MKKCFKGAGRPVLVHTSERYATGPSVDDKPVCIIIPNYSGFGAATYFNDEPKISHSIFCDEYDGPYCKWQYDDFIQASDEILMKHLESPMVLASFKERALELIKECPLGELGTPCSPNRGFPGP